MIIINLIKKDKGRVYKSKQIVRDFFGLELDHAESGAPLLFNGQYISISDTKNYWACAVSDSPLGIDIEELSRRASASIVRKFHKAEQEYLSVLSAGSREWTEELFSIWTRKEAYAKYTGKGLSVGFSKFSVLDNNVEGVPLGCFSAGNIMFGFAGDTEGSFAACDYQAPMEQPAIDYAAGLLDARAYSQAELEKKLTDRGYSAEEIRPALEMLKDYGYVNDSAYAQAIAQRAADSGKGSRRIEAELRQKGLEKELARDAASEYKEDDYSRALEIAKKMAAGAVPGASFGSDPDASVSAVPEDPEEKKEYYAQRQRLAGKISRKLASLGYEAGVIYAVLEDVIK